MPAVQIELAKICRIYILFKQSNEIGACLEVLSLKFSRRGFVHGISSAAAWALVSRPAHSMSECWSEQGQNLCQAAIFHDEFDRVRAVQDGMFWCWAATLAMIFNWHGRRIAQEDIVNQTFGGSFDVALPPHRLIQSVRRSYVDRDGNEFNVGSRVYSADHGIFQLSNCDIIGELAAEKPIVICNMTHMMVLIGVRYYKDMSCRSMNIYQGWVADPLSHGNWTPDMSLGFRDLFRPEMIPVNMNGQLRFMATISVD